MKPLNIAIINEYWNAGAERCARDLERFLSLRHTVQYYPHPGHDTVETILSALADFHPDIVHCHSYYSNLPYSFLSNVSHRYPTCFTPHDTRVSGATTMSPVCYRCANSHTCFRCPLVSRRRKALLLNPYFWQRLKKRYYNVRTNATLRIVTPSRWMKDRLMMTEWRRFPIHYIPLGIDLQRFHPNPNARQQLGFTEEQYLLLYVAYTPGWHTNPHKGQHVLADAFTSIILSKYPDAKLLIVGEGLVPNHPNVIPLGYISQENIPIHYSAADIVVVPSIADNFPYTVLEAMGCGAPVVASRVGGIPEAVEDGITGYVVPPADPDALGQAILSILDDNARQQQMARAARARVEEVFRIETFIQQYEDMYEEILATHNGY